MDLKNYTTITTQQKIEEKLKWVGKYALEMPLQISEDAKKDLYLNSVFLAKKEQLNLDTAINLCYRYPFLEEERPLSEYNTNNLLNYISSENIDKKDVATAKKLIDLNQKNNKHIANLFYFLDNMSTFDTCVDDYDNMVLLVEESCNQLINNSRLYIPTSIFANLINKYPDICEINPELVSQYTSLLKSNSYFDEKQFLGAIKKDNKEKVFGEN